MGDNYKVVWLGNKVYLEFRDQSTGWNTTEVFELKPEQEHAYQKFMDEQETRRHEFLKGLVEVG